MARGLNKAMIIGNLGDDPVIRQSNNGASIANISVATSETWKDKNTGDTQEKTEWHRISFFGNLADIVGKYLRKGSKIYVEGRIQTRKWQDQNGNDRWTTEIVGNEMQMLDSKGDSPAAAPEPQQQRQSATPKEPAPAPNMDQFDDDIPF